MADTTTGQEPTLGGQEPTGNNTAAAKRNEQDSKTFDEAYVKELRSEAAKYRKEAQDAKTKIAAFEQQQMSEAEKLQATAKAAQEAMQAAQAELRKARADAALARVAAKEGVDPELLSKLVTVEYDDAGAPVGLEAAAAAVLNKYPQLKPVATTATASATNPARTAKLTMEQVKKMSPAEINSRWDEVQALLAGG